ncbi:MAG: hypothetical protein S4CHLAM2_11230 [Chlamydiales bacterium]|nr:hypothetical protein [Chlamydiales bacterium]
MKKWLWFLLLQATLYSNETVVESNDAHYNGSTLTLAGQVVVEHAMGRVHAEKAVLNRDEAGTTKIDFPWIELSEAVCLTLPSGGRMECAAVFLDYTKMTSHFKGEPLVQFISEMGSVYASQADVDYVEVDQSIQPTQVILSDHVQLINAEADQYALADLVIYYPETQKMVLKGKESRVLFFDKTRNVQISAQTVHAEKNVHTGQDSIQGVGDVRFIFSPEELSRLKDQLKW